MNKRTRFVLACLGVAAALAGPALAQSGNNTGDPLDPRPNGPRRSDPGWHILLGPTAHVSPGRTIESAIVSIRDGRIEDVLDMSVVRFAPPAGAQVHDAAGLHVYAGFIDAHLAIDAPSPALDSPGAHWNGSVTPQRSALDAGGVPAGDAERLRRLGFTAAAIAPDGGIFAGRAALVSLAEAPSDPADGRPPVYRADAYQAVGFGRSGSNRGEFASYPNSQMGAIALIRQTLIDADWHAANGGGVSCLDHLRPQLGTPLLFRTDDELEGLRADKIAREFGRVYFVLGCGTEFRRLGAIPVGPENHTGMRPHYVLPLTLPEKPELDTIGKADSTDLRDLMTWEQAPTNARRLDEAGVHVCLTAGGLRRGEKFDDNLREALETGGLPADRALAMLTTNPAAMLGVADRMGTLEPGTVANLVVASGDLFDVSAEAEILDVWVDGRRHRINDPAPPFDGAWTFRVGDLFSMRMEVEGKKIKTIEGEGDDASEGKARSVQIAGRSISFLVDDTDDGTDTYVVSGILGTDGVIRGTGLDPDNNPFEWTATRDGAGEEAGEGEGDAEGLDGRWPVVLGGARTQLEIEIAGGGASLVEVRGDEREAGPGRDMELTDRSVRFVVDNGRGDATFTIEGELVAPGRLRGTALGSDGETFAWSAVREGDGLPPEALPGLPFGAYATEGPPPQRTVIFHNGTIWTSGPEGIIENGWVCIEGGKIRAVGRGGVIDVMTRDEPEMIDLGGRHLTPGLIDAHSHSGISRGINESGQSVTAEVRIGDVTDPDSLTWYRQLAGGVTTVNSMHGSSNPIGGQTQTNKVRWGVAHPDDMHMEGARPGIKFALGENVKQSNWESDRTRYPQTRMGVETLIRDRFIAAREYREATERHSDAATEGVSRIALGSGGLRHEDSDVSGPDRLAEGDGHGQGGLSGQRGDAARRAVRADAADAGLGGVGGGEHRGGPRAAEPAGLHPLSPGGTGIPPRDDDALRAGDLDGDDAGLLPDGGADGRGGPRAAGADPEPGVEARPGVTGAAPPSSLRRSVAPSPAPRRDLELEALAEILAGERLVHCHSYRQDEILMLCRVAEEFGFTIGTFQHGLEVYKVAEAVRDAAIGASLFSDWWAYKVEVQDAIAQAGPLQTEVGVLTSYNSDSNELARRMHVEAGKAYKYGGGRVSKEEALRFVTINPAIQLGIGDRVGSIEVGKDADLAVWSGEPVSSLSMCEAAWIDGREYFSLERDAALRERNAAERSRITRKILGDGAPEAKKVPEAEEPGGSPPGSVRERLAAAARSAHYLGLYLRGIDPAEHLCGDCGMAALRFGGER